MLGAVIALALGACAPTEQSPPPPGIPTEPVLIGSERWRVPGGALGWSGTDLLTVDRADLVRIDTQGNVERMPLGEGPEPTSAFAVSADHRYALVGRRHGDATLVELQSGETKLLDGDDDVVIATGFRPDGSVAVTLARPFRGAPPPGVTWTPGILGKRALLTRWWSRTGERLGSWQLEDCEAEGMALAGDQIFVVCDRLLQVVEKGSRTVRRVKWVQREPRRVLAARIEARRVTARGEVLAVGNSAGFEVWSSSQERVLQVPRRGVGALCWGPDDTLAVAVHDPESQIEVWRGTERLWSFEVEGWGVSAVAISEDGSVLAARQGSLLLRWDLTTGARLLGGTGHSSIVEAVAITDDGARVASSGVARGVLVHEVASGRRLAQWSVRSPEWITRVAIAGERVAALGRERLWVWEIGREEPLFELSLDEVDDIEDLDGVGGSLHLHRGGRRVRLTAEGLIDDGAGSRHTLEPNWRRFPLPTTAQGNVDDWFVTGHDHGTLRRWRRVVP